MALPVLDSTRTTRSSHKATIPKSFSLVTGRRTPKCFSVQSWMMVRTSSGVRLACPCGPTRAVNIRTSTPSSSQLSWSIDHAVFRMHPLPMRALALTTLFANTTLPGSMVAVGEMTAEGWMIAGVVKP